MVQVAEVVGVHETTVSRAVSGKYMETPQGIFEMKYFFTAGIQTASGDGMSNTSVKDMICRDLQRGRHQQTAVRPGSREDAEGKGHRHRPPHRGEVPHGAEHPAVELAEGLLRLWNSISSAQMRIDSARQFSEPGSAEASPCPRRRGGTIGVQEKH